VARNEKFQSLVAEAARACARNLPIDCSGTHQINYNSEELGDLKTSEEISTKLSDLVALNIGQIGENMNLRRGASIGSADKNIKLAYSSHPSQSVEEVLVGKYGAVVAYEESVDQPESLKDLPENVTVEKLPRQLCQHIIGLFQILQYLFDFVIATSMVIIYFFPYLFRSSLSYLYHKGS